MPLIQIQNLTKEYQTGEVVTPVLRGVSFSINRGEFVSIIGPSGSGKSTLMHILGFLDSLTGGKYIFNGEDVSSLTDDRLAAWRNSKVGFVFQAFNLLPRMSALDNVLVPLVYSRMPKSDWQAKGVELLQAVGLAHRHDHTPNQLSGGEKQRVAMARALVNNPEIILADEPTGNLDSKSGLAVMKILQALNQQGRTIILVTHERYTAEHAQRVIELKDGAIIADRQVDNRQHAEETGDLKK